MPQRIDRSDRLLLIGGGALLLLATLVAALFGHKPAETDIVERASAFRADHGGAMATLQLLRECGYDVRPWEHSPEALPQAEHAKRFTLVIAQPTTGSTRAERAALEQFVRAGGRLLIAGAADSLVAAAPAEFDFGDSARAWQRVAVARPSRRAAQVWMRSHAEWTRGVAGARTLYAGRSGPGVVAWADGDGEVVWFAGTTPLTNRGISAAGNMALVFDTLGRPGGRTVLWDEYFHGMRGSVRSYLLRTPLKWALLQLLVLFALVCLTWGRRFTPVRVPASESRASQLEFVEALGGLYARAGAAAFAVRATYENVRLRLARRLGLPPGTPAGVLAAAAEARLGAGGPRLAELMERAERAGREDASTSEGTALVLARALDDWDRRWTRGVRVQTPEPQHRREES